MFKLRQYQEDAVIGLRDAFKQGKRAPLLVAPTGAGKTMIFSHITQGAAAKGNRVLILVHRAELLQQTHDALNLLGVKHGLIAANRTPDPTQMVQLASVQTLVRRMDRMQPPDLIVLDEAHHCAAGSWKKIITRFRAARLIGVTATPERLDGKGLSDVFDALVLGPEVKTLISGGFLAPPIYYAPSVLDLTGVGKRMGDFSVSDLEKITNKPSITGCAVDHYGRLASGLPAVVFCASIRHAEEVAAQFCNAGYRFEVIDGTLAPEIRKQRVKDLASGKIQGLTSCDIISEGFDLPVVTVAILLRATQSLGLHLQQVGRVLRAHPDKSQAIILDHVGNCMRHGLAEEPREWSLEGAKARKAKEKSDPSLRNRQCPACYAVHPVGPSCPQCGHVYVVKTREIERREGELVMIKTEMYDRQSKSEREELERALSKEKRIEQGKAQDLKSLIDLAKLRGYRNPYAWAGHILKSRGKL